MTKLGSQEPCLSLAWKPDVVQNGTIAFCDSLPSTGRYGIVFGTAKISSRLCDIAPPGVTVCAVDDIERAACSVAAAVLREARVRRNGLYTVLGLKELDSRTAPAGWWLAGASGPVLEVAKGTSLETAVEVGRLTARHSGVLVHAGCMASQELRHLVEWLQPDMVLVGPRDAHRAPKQVPAVVLGTINEQGPDRWRERLWSCMEGARRRCAPSASARIPVPATHQLCRPHRASDSVP